MQVEAGDLLVVFSDGIIEAANAGDEEFGEERILAAVERNWAKSPAEIRDAILSAVKGFLGTGLPHDDQTLMVALQFTVRSSAASWQIDDLYVDPYRSG